MGDASKPRGITVVPDHKILASHVLGNGGQPSLDLPSARKFQRREKMSEQDSVVAVYDTHLEAEGAVKELQHAGIDMHLVHRW